MPSDGDALAARVATIRREIFGAGDGAGDGVAALSRALGIPARTWENYERGVTMPALVLLHFLKHTGAEPDWLLTGEGNRYRVRPADRNRSDSR